LCRGRKLSIQVDPAGQVRRNFVFCRARHSRNSISITYSITSFGANFNRLKRHLLLVNVHCEQPSIARHRVLEGTLDTVGALDRQYSNSGVSSERCKWWKKHGGRNLSVLKRPIDRITCFGITPFPVITTSPFDYQNGGGTFYWKKSKFLDNNNNNDTIN